MMVRWFYPSNCCDPSPYWDQIFQPIVDHTVVILHPIDTKTSSPWWFDDLIHQTVESAISFCLSVKNPTTLEDAASSRRDIVYGLHWTMAPTRLQYTVQLRSLRETACSYSGDVSLPVISWSLGEVQTRWLTESSTQGVAPPVDEDDNQDIAQVRSTHTLATGLSNKQLLMKCARLWRTIIHSSLGLTSYPYSQYIRTLNLGDLENMLAHEEFTTKIVKWTKSMLWVFSVFTFAYRNAENSLTYSHVFNVFLLLTLIQQFWILSVGLEMVKEPSLCCIDLL